MKCVHNIYVLVNVVFQVCVCVYLCVCLFITQYTWTSVLN